MVGSTVEQLQVPIELFLCFKLFFFQIKVLFQHYVDKLTVQFALVVLLIIAHCPETLLRVTSSIFTVAAGLLLRERPSDL